LRGKKANFSKKNTNNGTFLKQIPSPDFLARLLHHLSSENTSTSSQIPNGTEAISQTSNKHLKLLDFYQQFTTRLFDKFVP